MIQEPDETRTEDLQPNAPERRGEEIADIVEVAMLGQGLPTTVTDGLDLDAALAAVSSLSDVVAEQEAEAQAQQARIIEQQQTRAEAQARLANPSLFFPTPPMLALRPGRPASLLPALLLIGVGAWLTISLSTTRALPPVELLIAVVIGGLALILLARWLTGGRWAMGALFIGLTLVALAGVTAWLFQPGAPGLVAGWPLLLVALGGAVALTGLLARPRQGRLVLPGLLLAVAGLVSLSVTLNWLPPGSLPLIQQTGPAVLAVIALLLLLPAAFRRR